MIINQFPYFPVVEALRDHNSELYELVLQCGLPSSMIYEEVRVKFDWTFVSWPYHDLQYDTIRDVSLRFNPGPHWTRREYMSFTTNWVEGVSVDHDSEPLYSIHAARRMITDLLADDSWVMTHNAERHRHIYYFVQDTRDVFDYPSDYLDALDALSQNIV